MSTSGPSIASTDVSAGKPQTAVDEYNHRNNAFYAQTIEENNARLLAKFPDDPDLRSELEFIHADMIIAGPP